MRFLLVALLLAVGCATPDRRGPAVTSTAPGPLFCWKLEKEGRAPLWLLGSVHALPENRSDIDRALDDAFAAADTLVVEVDTLSIDQDEIARRAAAAGMIPDGEPTLDERLPPELWKRTEAAVGAAGVPGFVAKRFRPWLAALTVTMGGLQRAGFKQEMGVDHRFLRKARAAKKPVLELETMDEQLQLFAGLDEKTQTKMLEEAVATSDETEAMLFRLLDAWAAGDPDRLAAEVEGPLARDPSASTYYERWLYGRNVAMVDDLERLAADGRKHFVVVGAAHLVGARGMLRLMRDRGWTATQLSSASSASSSAPRSSTPPPPAPAAPPSPPAEDAPVSL